MNDKLVKILTILVILSVGFSIALCSYSALGDSRMPHHDYMYNFNNHLLMAHSFNVFIIPFSIILNLLLVFFVFVYQRLFIETFREERFVSKWIDEKIEQRLGFNYFSPRSPPKY
ncbi:MAG: hypothetical protein AB201_00925 [Parcubacteria bacterium C7867-006]|nr:MAG: hypothetical protein AB201_00925 [Parcubacteria bacterium C7867-006]